MAGPPSGGSWLIPFTGELSYLSGKNKHYMIVNNSFAITDLATQQDVDPGVDKATIVDLDVASDGQLLAIADNTIYKNGAVYKTIDKMVSAINAPFIPCDDIYLKYCSIYRYWDYSYGDGTVFDHYCCGINKDIDIGKTFGGIINYRGEMFTITTDYANTKYPYSLYCVTDVNNPIFTCKIGKVSFISSFFDIETYVIGYFVVDSKGDLYICTDGGAKDSNGKIIYPTYSKVSNYRFKFLSGSSCDQANAVYICNENSYCFTQAAISTTEAALEFINSETATTSSKAYVGFVENNSGALITEKGLECGYSNNSVLDGHYNITHDETFSTLNLAVFELNGEKYGAFFEINNVPSFTIINSVQSNNKPIGNGFYHDGTTLTTPSGRKFDAPFTLSKPIEDDNYVYAMGGSVSLDEWGIIVIKKSDGSFTIIPPTGGVRNINLSPADDIQKFKQDIATYLQSSQAG